jgi:hypothetical protein
MALLLTAPFVHMMAELVGGPRWLFPLMAC